MSRYKPLGILFYGQMSKVDHNTGQIMSDVKEKLMHSFFPVANKGFKKNVYICYNVFISDVLTFTGLFQTKTVKKKMV